MPTFFYRARDAQGRAREGLEVAASEDEVLRVLAQAQLTPVLIEARAAAAERTEAGTGRPLLVLVEMVRRWSRPIQQGSVALFARQLSTMITAGLPLVRSLRSIARDHHDRHLGSVLEQVTDDVQKGDALATALGRHPHVFDEVFVSLVQTGEISGTLDVVMEQTAGYLERAETLRLKVEAALRYPLFILTFAGLVLMAMFLKIVPMFAGIYERFKVQLPLPTQVLLDTSRVLTSNLLLITVLAIAGAAWFASWSRTERGRFAIDHAKFHLPVFGPLIRMYAVTKFARTLGMLTASGTHILSALRVLKPVPGNRVLERGIEEVRGQVEGGTSLSRAMADTGVFPDMLIQMTATGEETGRLDQMLTRTADFYEQRVTAKVEGLSSLVEPIAIVILGLVIGVMLLALYLPIFNLGQAMRSGMIGG
jgi:type II secretory pathway component PulF